MRVAAIRAAIAVGAAGVLLCVAWRRRRPARHAARLVRKRSFLRRAGAAYGYGGRLEASRSAAELPGLAPPVGRRGERDALIYLDYAGAALPLASQLAAAAELARSATVGNPHSEGPAAARASLALQRARQQQT